MGPNVNRRTAVDNRAAAASDRQRSGQSASDVNIRVEVKIGYQDRELFVGIKERVFSIPAGEDVVGAIALDGVIAFVAHEIIAAGSADDGVVAALAVDLVASAAAV